MFLSKDISYVEKEFLEDLIRENSHYFTLIKKGEELGDLNRDITIYDSVEFDGWVMEELIKDPELFMIAVINKNSVSLEDLKEDETDERVYLYMSHMEIQCIYIVRPGDRYEEDSVYKIRSEFDNE